MGKALSIALPVSLGFSPPLFASGISWPGENSEKPQGRRNGREDIGERGKERRVAEEKQRETEKTNRLP